MDFPGRSHTISPGAPARFWWVSLLLLGPVTGVLVGLCLASLKAHRPILAVGCAMALGAFWIATPALLGAELSRLPPAFRP